MDQSAFQMDHTVGIMGYVADQLSDEFKGLTGVLNGYDNGISENIGWFTR